MLYGPDIERLKTYFSGRKDIAFAFLFGSQTKGNATKLSDVDIAAYFYPEKKHPIEYEEAVYYENEDTVWADVERLLKKEVELLILNRVPATIAASALRGIPLAINDWGLYLDFMEVVTGEAEDFMDFIIRDYIEKQRE
ncbi:MAG: nucleotidyltransferase domain-containing protein [Candidatus Brocadia sp.]|jgi:predicted nucleotidyltransferase